MLLLLHTHTHTHTNILKTGILLLLEIGQTKSNNTMYIIIIIITIIDHGNKQTRKKIQ